MCVCVGGGGGGGRACAQIRVCMCMHCVSAKNAGQTFCKSMLLHRKYHPYVDVHIGHSTGKTH